jgi:hypothetical protein
LGSGNTTRTLGRSAPGNVSTPYQPLKTVSPVERSRRCQEVPRTSPSGPATVRTSLLIPWATSSGRSGRLSCSSLRAKRTEISHPNGQAAEHHCVHTWSRQRDVRS